MGRPRIHPSDLPTGMLYRRRTYYLVVSLPNKKTKWLPLGKTRDAALSEYRRLRGHFFGATHTGEFEQTLRKMLARTKRNAQAKKVHFAISLDDIREIGARSRWRCAITGLAFSLDKQQGCRFRPFIPSLDRINPSLGYIPGNLRMVCFAMNAALNQWGEDVFMLLATAYCEHHLPVKYHRSFGQLL